MAMFVLARNQLPRLMDMGEASEIASEVKRWRQSWGEDADGRLAAAQLSDRLWRPLVPLTEKATRLLVCPDGVVSGLPMSAIPIAADSSERLIDRFVIERVVSMAGSTPPRRNQEHTNLLLIGDVDYEFNGGEAPAVSTIALATPRGSIRYARLPGTRDEVLATKKLAEGSKQNLNAISLLGDQATESNVLDQLSRAKYAVLATHGFFQKQPSDITATQRVMSGFHPDVRSGIVLTGANASINRVGNVDDGILTALELKGFDLTGLRIAALSSCHSSEGVEVSGEGVLGLNRAFLAAGCQYTVSTLGPVDDVATQTLMTRFWTHVLVDELEPAVALRKAQLKLRESFVAEMRGSRSGLFIEDEPDTIASSARFWAPFVLTSR